MKIDSRSLEDLDRSTRHLARLLIQECLDQGMEIVIYSTFRNAEAQDWLYASGRTRKGPKVTNAKAGYSWHNFRCAFDAAPLNSKGKIDWNDQASFQKMGVIGSGLGLSWGGDWKRFKDMPHFENTGNKTLAQMRSIYGKEAPASLTGPR